MPPTRRRPASTESAPIRSITRRGLPTTRQTSVSTSTDSTTILLPRRSARIAAIEERRRESEEDALRQQRERIAHTHRNVRGLYQAGVVEPTMAPQIVSFLRRSPPPPAPPTPPRTLVRQNAIRRNNSHSRQGRMSATGARFRPPPRRPILLGRLPSGTIAPMHPFRSDILDLNGIPHLNLGLYIGVGNRYSSDSEDSYYQPRVIDPEAISEDETDDESTETRELTPVPSTASASVSPRRPVTRSMSSREDFYEEPTFSVPPLRRKKPTKNAKCKINEKAGTSSAVKTVIKVDKVSACTICYEDDPKKPVACMYCRQSIGCRYCVKKWFYTTNMSHLDHRTPYPIGGTDRNHKRCPLCRADWGESMQVCSAIETKDVFQKPDATLPVIS